MSFHIPICATQEQVDAINHDEALRVARIRRIVLRRELQCAQAFFNPAALRLSDLPERFEEAEEELRRLEETP